MAKFGASNNIVIQPMGEFYKVTDKHSLLFGQVGEEVTLFGNSGTMNIHFADGNIVTFALGDLERVTFEYYVSGEWIDPDELEYLKAQVNRGKPFDYRISEMWADVADFDFYAEEG